MRASRVVVFIGFFFVLIHSSRGQVSFSRHANPVGWYRLGIMETRSRTRIRATNSPSREVTEDGAQAKTKAFVGLSASATGHPGDGRISPRSTSLEAGPRRTCWPSARSESAGGAPGSAREVAETSYQGSVGLAVSHAAIEATRDADLISTLYLLC